MAEPIVPPYLVQTQMEPDMQSERVEFTNAKGETLSGVLEKPDAPPSTWAIFAHCFTCSKKSLAASRIARGLAQRGIGVLRFDFTGLGESEGAFATSGFSSNVSDLITAANWMSASGRQPSLLVGHSLGGAAVLVAAAQLHQIKAVATIGAPADAAHVIHQFQEHVPEIEAAGRAKVHLGGRPFELSKDFLDDLRTASVTGAVQTLRKPFLILHAPGDEIVSIDNATNLFVAAKHPKSFVSLDRADHLLTRKPDAAFVSDLIASWSARYALDGVTAPAPEAPNSNKIIVRETGENGPYQNEVLIDGRRYFADEPKSVGGADTGPNPYAWVAAGLGACTAITLRMYANLKKLPLARVTVSLEYEKKHAEDCIDCGPKDKIDVFTRTIELEGALGEAEKQRLLEIADRCPVHRTLENGAKVNTYLVTKPA
ncbi:MAG: bifunctional alpha/beta hydrolase/OsmC family protein [Pseudomonadota bacterium]